MQTDRRARRGAQVDRRPEGERPPAGVRRRRRASGSCYRHYALDSAGGEIWVGSATRYDGRKWSPLRSLAASSYLIDDRPALAAVEGGVVAVHVGDRRVATQNRGPE